MTIRLSPHATRAAVFGTAAAAVPNIEAAACDQNIVVKCHGPNMGVFAPLSMRPTDATVRKTGG